MQIVSHYLPFAFMGVVVYVITKKKGFVHCAYPFSNPRKASLTGIAAILFGWAMVSALFLAFAGSQDASEASDTIRTFGANDVISSMILALISFGPAYLLMRRQGEPLASARISRDNLKTATAIGLLLCVISFSGLFLGGDVSLGKVPRGLIGSHFWAFLNFAVVGFGEEFAFRGFLQTRMVAWIGTWQGWIATSVIMALAHTVQRVTVMNMSWPDALISSAALVPISLLMGFVMLRTRNILAPGLFHTFANWVNVLS